MAPDVLNIVALEEFFCPIPFFDLGLKEYTLEKYARTPNDFELLKSRVRDADVLLITTFPLTALALSPGISPRLRLVVVMSVGTDCVDLNACKARGIRVTNCPGVNTTSVAEHAITLMHAVRRRVVQSHQDMCMDHWHTLGLLFKGLNDPTGTAPLSWQDETVGIIGYGAIGQKIAALCQVLGMKVLIADRKNAPSSVDSSKTTRSPFSTVLKTATTIFLSLPRRNDTLNLLSTAEFSAMSQTTVLVNVSRGGIVEEQALIEALKQGQICGAACDVFEEEPAWSENSPLLQALRGSQGQAKSLPLIVTPHIAWYSEKTLENLQKMTQEIVCGWEKGHLREKYIVV